MGKGWEAAECSVKTKLGPPAQVQRRQALGAAAHSEDQTKPWVDAVPLSFSGWSLLPSACILSSGPSPWRFRRIGAGHPQASHMRPSSHHQATSEPPSCVPHASLKLPTCVPHASHMLPPSHLRASNGPLEAGKQGAEDGGRMAEDGRRKGGRETLNPKTESRNPKEIRKPNQQRRRQAPKTRPVARRSGLPTLGGAERHGGQVR